MTAKKLLIPHLTIEFFIKTYKKNYILNLLDRDRKRKTTVPLHRIIRRKIKVDCRRSAVKVKTEIEELDGLVQANAVRNRLHEIGLNGRVARKKPHVNKIN